MHLSNDALHRILSVPTVDTQAVVSYQLQDLWVSPAAMVTGGLTTLQASQLLNEGVFWRLEPILFCDQAARDLGAGIVFDGSHTLVSAASQYPSQYELSCRTGMIPVSASIISYGTPILQKSQTSGGTIINEEVGQSIGSIPYAYKPIKVSKIAFSKLIEWKHGFSVSRSITYTNAESRNVIDYANEINDEIDWTTAGSLSLYNNLTIAPIGLDEGNGTIDERFFTFAPKLEPSLLNSSVLQTLAEPTAIGWNYVPLETKTTSQPFPTTTDQQAAYITQEIVKLFPLDTSPITPLDSSEVEQLKTLQIYNLRSAEIQYLRDTATNYCSQFDWASQARDFDAVALRQRRLLDFNAIPIAPLELGKDYATLATSPDMGLQCYGDLPAIAWAPDPADESKVFALCRYRPPIRVPLPNWDWPDINLPSNIKDCYYYEQVGEDRFEPRITSVGQKLPFHWVALKNQVGTYPAQISFHEVSLLNGWDPATTEAKLISKIAGITTSPKLNNYFEAYINPLGFGASDGEDPYGSGAEMCNLFYPAFSQKQAVQFAPRFIRVRFSFPYLTPAPLPPPPQEPPDPPDPEVVNLVDGLILLVKEENPFGNGIEYRQETIISCLDPVKKSEVEDEVAGFKDWANGFFLSESSYTEIGRYRWLDENGTPMVDEPFFGHAAIFNAFNIDIRLTPAPA